MAKGNKTTETTQSVDDFIAKIEGEAKRDDCYTLIKALKKETGFDAKMWGPSIIGFGTYHYKYDSGREGDMPLAAFSPRKPAFVVYLYKDFEKRDELSAKLGKYKQKGGCFHIKKLEDVDMKILMKMVNATIKKIKATYK